MAGTSPAMTKTDDSRLYRLPFVTGSAIISRAHLISGVDLSRSRQHLRRRSYTRILMLDWDTDVDRQASGARLQSNGLSALYFGRSALPPSARGSKGPI